MNFYRALFLVLLFSLTTMVVNGSIDSKTDSLRQMINGQKGEEKLKTLRLISIESEFEAKRKAIDELIKEAKIQSNNLYLAIGYDHRSHLEGSHSQVDSMQFYAEKGIEYTQKIDIERVGDKELYNRVTIYLYEKLSLSYILQNKYHLAIFHVHKMLELSKKSNDKIMENTAYLYMATIYNFMNKPDEAIISGKKVLGSDKKLKIHALIQLVVAYENKKQYDEVLSQAKTLEILVKEQFEIGTKSEHKAMTEVLAFSYSSSALIYIEQGKLDEAEVLMNKIEKLTSPSNPLDEARYCYLEARYYLKTKNYTKALEKINIAYPSISALTPLANVEMQTIKSEILRGVGNINEAYDFLLSSFQKNDSIHKIIFSNELAEIETLYEVDKLNNKLELKEQKLLFFRLLIAGLILIVFLTIFAVFIVIRGNKSLKNKNLDLYKKHRSLEGALQMIENIKKEKAQAEEDLDPNSTLVSKLDKHMIESKDYLNTQITRDDIAAELGTNRQYLIQAIRECKNQTFNEYIYAFRLAYVYQELKNNNLPISIIFENSGFMSQTVFNKEFKKLYGMTPAEMRVAIREASRSSDV